MVLPSCLTQKDTESCLLEETDEMVTEAKDGKIAPLTLFRFYPLTYQRQNKTTFLMSKT